MSAAFFSGNIDKTRLFLHEYGYMKEMISKSRLNHRPHAQRLRVGGSSNMSSTGGAGTPQATAYAATPSETV